MMAIGYVLFCAGLGLRLWSIYTLRGVGVSGTSFDLVKLPPRIASGGPYRLCRHPAYLGSLAMIAGVGMAALGAPGAVLAVPAWPFYWDRMVRENEILYPQGEE